MAMSSAHIKDKWWTLVCATSRKRKVIYRTDFMSLSIAWSRPCLWQTKRWSVLMFSLFFPYEGKWKLVHHCILVQDSLLSNQCRSEMGVMVNASIGRIEQEKILSQNNTTVPQCHSLPASITKGTLKQAFCSPIHPPDPDALCPFGSFLWFHSDFINICLVWVFSGR